MDRNGISEFCDSFCATYVRYVKCRLTFWFSLCCILILMKVLMNCLCPGFWPQHQSFWVTAIVATFVHNFLQYQGSWPQLQFKTTSMEMQVYGFFSVETNGNGGIGIFHCGNQCSHIIHKFKLFLIYEIKLFLVLWFSE